MTKDTNPLDKNLAKMQRLLSLMDEDGLTEQKFLDAFQTVIGFVKKMKEEVSAELGSLNTRYDKIVQSIKDNYNDDIQGIKKEITEHCEMMIGDMSDGNNGRIKAMEAKIKEIRDGKDADEELVAHKASNLAVTACLEQIPTIEAIENDLPKLGANIASALELLPDGEKLKIEAIEGLQELLNEIKKGSNKILGGGGFNYSSLNIHILDPYTPTGTVNGVNTDFVLSHTPNPATSLKVYRNGQLQSLTEDFTLSGRTVTFLVAPDTGENIKAEHRI